MKKLLGVLGLMSCSVFAQDVAHVIRIEPRYVTVNQQRCEQVVVREDNSTAGTIIGGVAGGIIGHQVGKGTGRDVATVLGAVTGAAVGNSIGNQQAQNSTRTVCQYVPTQVQQGKIVTFQYQGVMFTQTFTN